MRVFDDFGRDVSELMVPSSTTNYSSIFDSKAENLEATFLPSSSGRKEHNVGPITSAATTGTTNTTTGISLGDTFGRELFEPTPLPASMNTSARAGELLDFELIPFEVMLRSAEEHRRAVVQGRNKPFLPPSVRNQQSDGHHRSSARSSIKSSRIKPPFLIKLRSADIICGRATKQIELHPGNQRFRALIAMYRPHYKSDQSQSHKTMVVDALLNDIASGGGKFVEKVVLLPNGTAKPYMEQDCIEDGAMIVYRVVGHRIVNEKVRKALRRSSRTR